MRPLEGHRLLEYGGPHDEQGEVCGRVYGAGNRSIEGPGAARCECGQLSPQLSNRRRRRDWHRMHKNDVLADAWAQTPVGQAILRGTPTPAPTDTERVAEGGAV